MNINKYLLPVIVAMRHSICDLVSDTYQDLIPGAENRTRVQNQLLFALVSGSMDVSEFESFPLPASLVPYVEEIQKAYQHIVNQQTLAVSYLEPHCQDITEEEAVKTETLLKTIQPLIDRGTAIVDIFVNMPTEDGEKGNIQVLEGFEVLVKDITALVDEFRQSYANA